MMNSTEIRFDDSSSDFHVFLRRIMDIICGKRINHVFHAEALWHAERFEANDRIAIPLSGCHQMLVSRNESAPELIQPMPGTAVFMPKGCWNQPDWKLPVQTATFIFALDTYRIHLVEASGVDVSDDSKKTPEPVEVEGGCAAIPHVRDARSPRLGTGKNVEKSTIKGGEDKEESIRDAVYSSEKKSPSSFMVKDAGKLKKLTIFACPNPPSRNTTTLLDIVRNLIAKNVEPQLINTLIESIALSALNDFKESGKTSSQEMNKSDRTWRDIDAYLKENCGANINRMAIASAFNLTPNYLSALCREKTGGTFTCCLNDYRLRRAEAMLTSTQASIEEIAWLCGFSDSSYFGRVFRKRHGVSPGVYRAMS